MRFSEVEAGVDFATRLALDIGQDPKNMLLKSLETFVIRWPDRIARCKAGCSPHGGAQ